MEVRCMANGIARHRNAASAAAPLKQVQATSKDVESTTNRRMNIGRIHPHPCPLPQAGEGEKKERRDSAERKRRTAAEPQDAAATSHHN